MTKREFQCKSCGITYWFDVDNSKEATRWEIIKGIISYTSNCPVCGHTNLLREKKENVANFHYDK